MKTLRISLLLLIFVSVLHAQEQKEPVTDPYNGEEILFGKVNPEAFLQEPYSEWYLKEYNSYEPDPAVMEVLDRDILSTWFVTIVLGTWCSDSQREFPRFMKIWEELGLNADQLTIITVNSKKEAPFDETSGLDIEKVPTFIFYQCNMELGRVVESPEETIEKELFRVLFEF